LGWNHNVHYHQAVLNAMPRPCACALEIGCGRGDLARRMAGLCAKVLAIDNDPACLAVARELPGLPANVTFLEGDFLSCPFPEASFDFVVAVASLHHLPMRNALEKCACILRPGGTLAVVGLFRIENLLDYVLGCLALPLSWGIRSLCSEQEVGAPLCEPTLTLAQLRGQFNSTLPGGELRRRLFFRYTFVWTKP